MPHCWKSHATAHIIILFGLRLFILGGVNIEGHPLVSFPPECTIGLLQSSAGSLLKLLQYYVRIAGPKISVLLSMRDKWTESGIVKIITVFDELQVRLKAAYSVTMNIFRKIFFSF